LILSVYHTYSQDRDRWWALMNAINLTEVIPLCNSKYISI
jgi:hypothetical protein